MVVKAYDFFLIFLFITIEFVEECKLDIFVYIIDIA